MLHVRTASQMLGSSDMEWLCVDGVPNRMGWCKPHHIEGVESRHMMRRIKPVVP